MHRSIAAGAIAAAALACASLPLLAADTTVWPWKNKLPPDPALVTLTSVENVHAAINKGDKPTITVTVGATTATPGFTELQLAPRIGDPKDTVFAFDAKGRPPQDMTIQVVSPVSFSIEYTDAPIDKVGTIEVHGQSNCKAFSLKDNKDVDCSSSSVPQ
jgi:hypothetical protein